MQPGKAQNWTRVALLGAVAQCTFQNSLRICAESQEFMQHTPRRGAPLKKWMAPMQSEPANMQK